MSSELTLGELLNTAQRLYQAIEDSNLGASDLSYQEDVIKALNMFSRCADMVVSLSMFSANETVEDINTTDLRFLLVEAYLGNLTSKLVGGERLDILNRAKRYHEQFLQSVELHGILLEEDRKYIEEQTQGIKNFLKIREEKISRLKRKKETEKELMELQRQISVLGEKDTEDLDRKHVIKLIELFVQKSIDELSTIRQEIELLEQMHRSREQNDSLHNGMGKEQDHQRIDPSGPLLSKEGRPLQWFTITNDREAKRQQVFGPSWRLPSISVGEYLEQERKRGNIIEGGGKMPEKQETDDNDEEAIDAATYKARKFDDFKDTNPRGWGELSWGIRSPVFPNWGHIFSILCRQSYGKGLVIGKEFDEQI